MKPPVDWNYVVHQSSAALTAIMGFLMASDLTSVVSHVWAGRILLLAGILKIVFNQLANPAP